MSSPLDDIEAQLTGPGGPFEVTTDVIDGVEMKVFASRFPSLRTVAEFGMSHADKTFIVFGDRRITFSEFFADANSLGNHLRDDAGIGHGDRVAVLAQNTPEWCLTFWGTVSIGAVLVGLNGWWTTDEVLYGLEDSGARVLVADRKRFERIADQLDEIVTERVYLIDADPSEFGSHPKLHRFDELTADPTLELPRPANGTEIDEADHAVIFYTSGTTGRPKGAISTHRSMIANLQNTVFLLTANAISLANSGDSPPSPAGGQQVALFTSPLFHVSGCHSTLVVGVLGGLKLVMVDGKFEPRRALELIEAEGVTTWSTVPTMIWRTCQDPARHDHDLSTVGSLAFGE